MGNFGIDIDTDLKTPGSISVTEPYGGSNAGSLWGGIMQGVGTVLNMIPLGWTQVLGTALTIGGQVVKGTMNESPTAGSTKVTPAQDAPVSPVTSVGEYNPYSSQVSGPGSISGISGSSPGGFSMDIGSTTKSLSDLAKATGLYDKIKDWAGSKSGDVSGFGSGIDWSSLGSDDWNTFKSGALNDLYSYGSYGTDMASTTSDLMSSSGGYWDDLLNYFSMGQ